MLVRNNCYSNRQYLNIKENPRENSLNQSSARNDVSFCAMGMQYKRGLFWAGVLASAYLGINAVEVMRAAGPSKSQYPQVQRKESGWEPNTRVLASVGQDVVGVATENDSYSLRLLQTLSQPGINTLEQANASLMKTGYRVVPKLRILPEALYFPAERVGKYLFDDKRYFPTETNTAPLGIFNKVEKDKERFVIALYDGEDALYPKLTDSFCDGLKSTYDLKSENIQKIKLRRSEDIEEALDSVLSKVAKLKDRGSAELLMLYSGHGDIPDMSKPKVEPEGAKEGIIRGVLEYQVKEIFRQKLRGLQGLRTLFINDSCHSGAWISQAGERFFRTFG